VSWIWAGPDWTLQGPSHSGSGPTHCPPPPAGEVEAGFTVEVVIEFTSNDTSGKRLIKGLTGKVMRIDYSTGSALIAFDHLSEWWVAEEDFVNLIIRNPGVGMIQATTL
jgi:hypothetical protein